MKTRVIGFKLKVVHAAWMVIYARAIALVRSIVSPVSWGVIAKMEQTVPMRRSAFVVRQRETVILIGA